MTTPPTTPAAPFAFTYPYDLAGRAALVTGAGTDAGRAVALLLAAQGAQVAAGDVNPDSIEQVAETITAAGGRAVALHGDVANRFQASALIEGTRDAFGRLDILVNAAAVHKVGPFDAIDEWDWRRVLDINLTGAFFCTQLAARVMADENAERGGGVIVNFVAPLHGIATQATAYNAGRWALAGLTYAAAVELAPRGVRVCGVAVPPFSGDDPRIAAAAAAVSHLVVTGQSGMILGLSESGL